jgi:hypothetical protein
MAIAPASVQFATTKTIVKEKSGAVAVIDITRTGGSDIAATVNFSTAGGTGTAGADYTAVLNQTITFAPGETLKRVMVPILSDATAEADETIRLSLTTPTGGTTILGDTVEALVTIQGKKLV